MSATITRFSCCYGVADHTDTCCLRDLPAVIPPELAQALLVELAAAFDVPGSPTRRWSHAVDRAVEAGRRLAVAGPPKCATCDGRGVVADKSRLVES